MSLLLSALIYNHEIELFDAEVYMEKTLKWAKIDQDTPEEPHSTPYILLGPC